MATTGSPRTGGRAEDAEDGGPDTASAEPADADLPSDEIGDPAPIPELSWHRTWVDERAVQYADGGDGLPVLFLHGWALGNRAYRHALTRLVQLGCRVVAPSLPGLGGTAGLPDRNFSLHGYADWVTAFLQAVGVDEPVLVVGHSFGGGVAIKFAHAEPDRVRSLVLVNSIGGSVWKEGGSRTMAERPLWDWGLHFPTDIMWPIPQAARLLPVMAGELVPNLIQNPLGLWKVAVLARRADLTKELEDLKAWELPVVVLWGVRDAILPRASFDALCQALGTDGEVVDGNHSWLLADPDAFGEVITNHVQVAKLARGLETSEAPGSRWGRLGRSRPRRDRLRTLDRIDGAPS